MALTRRRLLAMGGCVATGLTAGCAGRTPLDRLTNGGNGSGGTATTEGGTEAGTATGTATATPTPSVRADGDETDRLYAELAWFATQYRPTVDRYRSTAERARSLIATLGRQSSVGADDVDRLRGLLARVEELVYEGLVPHFDAEPTVHSFNDEHLDRLSTMRQRHDWVGAKRVLEEMASRYRTLASESYVERTFPTEPIEGPLARLLTADGAAPETAVVCYLPPVDYLVRVQADPRAYEGELAGGRNDVRRYEELVGPTSVGADRESRAFLTYTSFAHGLHSQPVYLQRYRGVQAAENAVDRMLSASGSVTADETATLGGAEWRRVYYQAAGGVRYAHLHRTGRYVLTVAPSGTPWNERPSDWTTALERTWFWE